jgi:hypothetical protein
MLVRPVLFNVSNCIRASNSHWSVQNWVTLCVRGLVVPCYDPYLTVHCEYFSFSALSLGTGQAWLLVDLAGAVSGTSIFLSHWTAMLLLYFFSQLVFAHTTSAISHYPISVRYVPYSFCTHHICHISLPYIWQLCPLQFLHTPHLPYLTILYLTATFQPTLFNRIR